MRRQVSSTLSHRAPQADRQGRNVSGVRRSRYTTFAQVPLLNQSQLVASWREMLPRVQDAEGRRLPLELPGPGAYLVEAVSPPHRAYTIVIVSDVGLVTKTAPEQALMFAANRFTRRAARQLRRPAWSSIRKSVFSGSDRRRRHRRSRRSTPAQARRADRRRAVRQRDRRRRSRRVSVPAARRATSSATSTPTSRSTGPATPCG